ncbi:MAG: MASE1 domain-containing protein [Nibricoccus sp.]
MPRPRVNPALLACAGYLLLRVLTHFTSSWFEVSPGIALWYPPCGLALSLLILFGTRYMGVVFVANVLLSATFPEFSLLWLALFLAALNTINYAAAAWLVRRFLGGVLLPGEARATLIFIAIVILSPATMALSGNLVLTTVGITPPHEFWSSVLNWWVGDVSGLLTVVPPIMVFAAPWLRGETRALDQNQRSSSWGIVALQSLVLIGCILIVFAWKPFGRFTPFYLCFLPLIWICFCHGMVGATIATLVITMAGLIGLHFSGNSTPLLVIHFLFFELAIACVGLGLGSAITRRNKIQRDLTISQAKALRLLQVIEATTDFVVITDEKALIVYANTSLLRLLGKGPLANLRQQNFVELLPPATNKLLINDALPAAKSTGAWHGEATFFDGAHREIPVSIVVQAHRNEGEKGIIYSFVVRNIERQKQAEAARLENERHLQQVQKLESLGVLAGGIAHDFNNLLTPLLGYASLARLDLPDDSPVQQTLQKIEKSTERAAALCQQMLAYAGRNPLAFSEIDLSRLIDETSQLLRVTTGKKRTLQFELTRPLPPITADPTQLRQVLMNLALNASEAIGENPGTIAIRTRQEAVTFATLSARFHGRAPSPGQYVVLEVEDNGSGMTPEVYTRIFEPFFSTKFAGHGLGLAAVLGIIKSHNGAIHVKTEQGKGTIFRVFFPAAAPTARDNTAAQNNTGPWRGSGQVLVVDDEPEVRAVVARALEVTGFTAKQAVDGLDGLEYFQKNSHELRLVLLDLTMPRMDGEQAFIEMHRINPSVPVILMSGYSQKLSLDRFSHAKPAAFLSKPFDFRVLQSCLRQLPSLKNG